MIAGLSSFPNYILGDTFLRNYFVAFNYTAPYSLSLAPSAFSPAGKLVPYLGTVPPSPSPPSPTPNVAGLGPYVTYGLIGIAVIFGLFLIYTVLKSCGCIGKQRIPADAYQPVN